MSQPSTSPAFMGRINDELEAISKAGTRKIERVIFSPQDTQIRVGDDKSAPEEASRTVLNMCANNYLGLANDARLLSAAHEGLEKYGFGMASVRFICGTQDIHRALEKRLAEFLNMEASILFPSCFDANGALFETLLGPEDAVISDSLNHASIIDGIRLCKAQRFRYANADLGELEEKLKQAQSCRHRLIATDGVFSMDGVYAPLPGICDLAEKYDAFVMVDDCHATGFTGQNGRGTPEHFGVEGRVQILTGTFGKALGGASGGYVAGPRAIIDLLRQRARPYLFSNAIMPAICVATLKAIEIVEQAGEARRALQENTARFRGAMAGFTLKGDSHPIVPVMIGDAGLAAKMADDLLERGIYVIAFSYPVVPMGQARIRVQMSATHSFDEIDNCAAAFIEAGKKFGLID